MSQSMIVKLNKQPASSRLSAVHAVSVYHSQHREQLTKEQLQRNGKCLCMRNVWLVSTLLQRDQDC